MKYEDSSDLNASRLIALGQGVEYYNKIFRDGYDTGDKATTFGSGLHCYFLENNEFKDRFAIPTGSRPSNVKQKEYCSALSSCQSTTKSVRIEEYKKIYSIKGKKEADIETLSTQMYIRFKEYIEFLKTAKNRLILNEEDYLKLKTVENKFKSHKGINYLLYTDVPSMYVYNELPIFFTHDGIKCKAKLDRLVIDLKLKRVFVVDIKTHSTKNLRVNIRKSFRDSFTHYGYHVQQAFYSVAAKEFMKDVLKIHDIEKYTIHNYIILVQSNFLNTVKLIDVGGDNIYEGAIEMKSLINKYGQHMEKGFDRELEYYESELGTEKMQT
jgi:hypothetical protein